MNDTPTSAPATETPPATPAQGHATAAPAVGVAIPSAAGPSVNSHASPDSVPPAVSAPAPANPPSPAPPDPRIAEMEAKLAAMQTKQDAAVSEHRNALLDRLGVLPKYREIAPAVDPFSTEGKAKLEQWAAAHPEICQAQAPVTAAWNPGDDMKKKPGAVLVDLAKARQTMFGRG